GNISVFRTNTLPTANSFTVQTKKTTALDIDLKTLGAVSDPDFGDGLDYSVPSTIEGGSLTGTETPYIFTFTPDASFNGTSFVYTVTDQFGDNIAVEATATINLENTPPTANDINLATTGDQTVLIDVSEVISDPDEGNDSLFVVFNSNSLSVSGGDLVKGELPNHQIEFTPDPASFTTTSFSYSVTDSTGAWDTGTITISRNNSPPLALDVPVTPVLPWNQSREININEFISDPDEADSTLSFNPQPVTPIEAGSYEIATAKHGIVFTPTVGYSGLASIPYSVSDSGGSTSATRHITINIVAPANDSPVAKDVVLATKGNTSLRINLLTLDAISDPNQSADSLDVTFPQAVPGGTLSQEEVPYIVVFRPNEAFATSTNFNYTVIDQGGLEAVGTITINRENTAPTAENAVITPDMNWNVTRSVNLMNYITDADQQKSTLKIAIGEISPANAGDISRDDTRDPVYLYLPAEGFVGAATLSYTVTDDQEAQTQGTITWNVVAPQNTTLPSELTPPEYEGGAPLVLDLRDYAPQISSVPGLQVSIPQAPQHGTASIEQLTVTYIPDQTYSGADSFEILIANNLGFNSKMRVSTELVATNEKPSEAPGGPLVAFDITQGKLQQNSSLGSTSVPLGFVLKDQLGNPINGATVVWSMSSSNPDSIPSDGKARAIIVGGTPDVTDTTGADGASAVTITAGAVPEILTVSAQATGTLGVDPFDETLSFTISVGLKAIVSEDTPEGAVAKVIDTMCPSLAKTADRNADEEALNTLCDNIISDSASGNNAAAQQALKAIAPEEVAQQTRMAQSIAGQQLGNIGTRLSALRRGISGVAVSDFSFRMQGQSVPSSVFYDLLPSYLDQELKNNPRLGGFISGSLGKGSYDAFKNEDSFEFKTKGITAGVDYRYNRQFVLGGALGYSNTDLELGTSSGDINANGLNLALYSTYYHKDSFYVDGIFTLGNTSYDMNRNIVFSSGSTLYNRTANGQTESALYVLSLGAGYELASESGWVLGFNGRFNTVRVHIDAYDESGAQELNMSISSQAIDLYSSSLGGNISKALSFRWGVMVPQISGSYEHEFQADVGTVQGSFVNDRFNTSFAFETEEIDNNYFRVGVGSTFVLPKGRTGFVQYERTVFRYRYNDYRIAVGGRLEF
ncbi:MAG: autotransporter domain-containing protein, partial [Gammaproteobacteria bacterium]|nr:autotransporter domain-containing protein [Gammaproteobacteria bacterium]